MRRGAVGLVVAVAVAAFAMWQEQADALGIKGKFEVRTLELGYALGPKTLKLRAVPVAGPVVELQTADAETIDRLFRLADIKNRGGRLAVEIDGEEIKAIDVAVGAAFAAGQPE